MPAPSISIRLRHRVSLQQDSAPKPLLARVTPLDLIILFRTRGQGLAAAGTSNVGGQVDPGGGAAVRYARTPRQAHWDLAPGMALHVVDHNSRDARAVA